jgi:hypothetical protein
VALLDLIEKLSRWRRYEETVAAGVYPYFRPIQESHNGTRVLIQE